MENKRIRLDGPSEPDDVDTNLQSSNDGARSKQTLKKQGSDRSMDEVDIARPSLQSNGNRDYDNVDSKPDSNVCSGQAQAQSIPKLLPNPGASRDDEEYPMGRPYRGVALIFNHKKFDVRKYGDRLYQPKVRDGTDVDRDLLIETFESLGFDARPFDDRSYNEITTEIRDVALENHQNRDCIAVAVLSHGDRNGRLVAKDRDYHISKLWEPLTASNCHTLAGKPKLFFIQACRGNDTDVGVMVRGVARDCTDLSLTEEICYPVPSYADILVSYSTFDGQCSFRNDKYGTWYVQTLCYELKKHGRTKDLLSLLTCVNRLVGQRFRSESDDPNLHGMVQIPCFTSSLTRGLCFGQNAKMPERPSADGCSCKCA